MVFKDFCVLVFWTKVASALEGLIPFKGNVLLYATRTDCRAFADRSVEREKKLLYGSQIFNNKICSNRSICFYYVYVFLIYVPFYLNKVYD